MKHRLEPQRSAVTRRQFINGLGIGLLCASLPALTACHNFQPRPFIAGAPIAPPLGCTELRQRNPQGDC